MIELGAPLYRVGGYRLVLLLPILGCAAAAFAARALARRMGADDRRAWLAYWVTALASPLAVYALDAWEHTLGVALVAWGVVALLDAVDDSGLPWRGLLAGLAFGAAFSMRTESLVYGFVATALALGWVLLRRQVGRAIGLGVAVVVGLALMLLANLWLESAALGSSFRAGRASGTASAAGAGLALRAKEALLTTFGLQSGISWDSLLPGVLTSVLLIALLVLLLRRADRRVVVGVGLALGAMVLARLVDGPGFVPGLLPAAPLAAFGLVVTWWLRDRPAVRYVAALAVFSLPLVWMFQYTGGAGPQWGGRYVLVSGLLLATVGVVGLDRIPFRAATALVGAALVVTLLGVGWLSVRSHEVGDAARFIAERPEPVVISTGAVLAPRARRRVRRVPLAERRHPDPARCRSRVVDDAGFDSFALLEVDPRPDALRGARVRAGRRGGEVVAGRTVPDHHLRTSTVIRRVWCLPLGAHTIALLVVAGVAIALAGPGAAFFSDEGAVVAQAQLLETSDTWIYEPFQGVADPEQAARPFENADYGTSGVAPYAKHPLYPATLARLPGSPTGWAVVLSLAGLVTAAFAAALIARQIDPSARSLHRLTLWVVGAASPLLFASGLVVAHTLAAAAAGLAVWAGAALLVRRPRSGGRDLALLVVVAGACGAAAMLRSEALFLAPAVAIAVLLSASSDRRVRGAMVGVAAVVWCRRRGAGRSGVALFHHRRHVERPDRQRGTGHRVLGTRSSARPLHDPRPGRVLAHAGSGAPGLAGCAAPRRRRGGLASAVAADRHRDGDLLRGRRPVRRAPPGRTDDGHPRAAGRLSAAGGADRPARSAGAHEPWRPIPPARGRDVPRCDRADPVPQRRRPRMGLALRQLRDPGAGPPGALGRVAGRGRPRRRPCHVAAGARAGSARGAGAGRPEPAGPGVVAPCGPSGRVLDAGRGRPGRDRRAAGPSSCRGTGCCRRSSTPCSTTTSGSSPTAPRSRPTPSGWPTPGSTGSSWSVPARSPSSTSSASRGGGPWPAARMRPTTSSCSRTSVREVGGTDMLARWISSSSVVPVSTTSATSRSELPRDKLIVFTGLSGSGKSSLAFDTIYAEGQRRYVESLSAYARQFLGQMDKPDVDFIEGLSPAISIDQKSASRNPRSTVGTITEVYDYLRLLYAAHRRAALPERRHGDHPPDAAADRRPHPRAARGHPLPGARAGGARPQGHLRHPARRSRRPRASPGPSSTASSTSSPTRSSSPATSSTRSRSSSTAWSGATASSGGSPTRSRRRCASPRAWPRSRSWAATTTPASTTRSSPSASTSAVPPAGSASRSWPPATSRSTRRTARASTATASARASRSTPSWWCPTRISPSPRAPSRRGPRPARSTSRRLLESVCEDQRHRHRRAVVEAPQEAAEAAALRHRGVGQVQGAVQEPLRPAAVLRRQVRGRHPVAPASSLRRRERQHAGADRGLHARGAVPRRAAVPGSSRFSLGVTIDGHTSRDVCDMSIADAAKALAGLELSERDRMIAERVVKEVNARMGFLLDVGLDYLSLGRSAGTLAGGEAQRIRLASPDRLGSGRRALRARRAVDRSAPARQPAAHRHAHPPARPRQHRARRRARRGHHQGRRLRRRHRSRARASTAATSSTPVR